MIDESMIRDVPVLAGLSNACIRELAQRGQLRSFPTDAVLWTAGMQPRELLIILDGEVRVVSASGGRQHVIHTETRGGTLGDVALFQNRPYPATALAARPTRCAAFDTDAIHAAIRADTRLAFIFLERLAGRVRILIDRLDRLAARSVPARVAEYVLARHTASGAASFSLGLTQQGVAEELGTVREVVVRALRSLRDAGILEACGGGRYRLLDEGRLRRLAAE